MGFEPTILVLERAKTVRALDRAATAIGIYQYEFVFLTTVRLSLLPQGPRHMEIREIKDSTHSLDYYLNLFPRVSYYFYISTALVFCILIFSRYEACILCVFTIYVCYGITHNLEMALAMQNSAQQSN
jgi:hypothetical protein